MSQPRPGRYDVRDVFGFFDLDGFPGYQVQLLAGGVVVAQDNDSLHGSIPEGEFRLSTVSLTTGATHAQLGQPLEVRLINLNVIEPPADPGIEVDFDEVQLTASPAAGIPAASQWGLLAMSLPVCIAGTMALRLRTAENRAGKGGRSANKRCWSEWAVVWNRRAIGSLPLLTKCKSRYNG